MLQRLIIIVVVMLVCGFADRAAAQEAIGTVSRIQGEASATRPGASRALGVNVLGVSQRDRLDRPSGAA